MKRIFPALFLLVAVRLLGVTPVPYFEGVSFSSKITGTGTSLMTVYAESTASVNDTVSSGTHESTIGTAWLKPGKTYAVNFSGNGPTAYDLSFTAPDGYAVYLNNLPADLWSRTGLSGSYSHDYVLEIRPVASASGAEYSNFSGIAVGKSVTWSVGLGSLRTGRGAGVVYFKEADLTNSPASRNRLYYTAPSNIGQIGVIRDGPSNLQLRQIVVPVGFVDFVDILGGYEIRFYDWSQVSSWTGTLYTFTGSPWKTIKVETPGSSQLRITETEGSVVRVSLLTGTGSSGITGGTVTTNDGYTIHTFNSNGTFAVGGSVPTADYVMVAGGGGGGNATNATSGGGGGGDVKTGSLSSLTGSYAVVVGGGGAAGASGSNSTFNGMTAYGGGRGGSNTSGAATSGGSGGGGQTNTGGAAAGSGANVRAGGGGDNGSYGWTAGAGGGAGAVGGGLATGVFNGGNGISSSISGTLTYYGGGGGGGGVNSFHPTTGGLGGGGGNPNGKTGTNGTANTGGGGGGAGADNNSGLTYSGGTGGSGVVIIRYPTMSTGDFVWTLQEGDGSTVLRTTTHTSTVPTSGQRDDVVVVRTGGPAGTIVAKTKFHYVTQAWGEELSQVIADPDTAALTTTYTYYTSNTAYGNYRKVKSVTDPTGNWTAYEYYDDYAKRGQLYREYHPYLDSPGTVTLDPAQGRVVTLTYTYDWTGRYRELNTRQEKINNVVTANLLRNQDYDPSTTLPRERYNDEASYDATHTQETQVQYYRADAGDADFVGQLCRLVTPNIAQVSGSVSRGTYNDTTKVLTVNSSGDHWRVLQFHGSYSNDATWGTPTQVTAFDGQTCDPVWMIPNKSTVDVTIRIGMGVIYRNATYVYTGGTSFALLAYEDFTYNGHGLLTQRSASNGALTSYTYVNSQLTSSVEPSGTETQFTYDGLERVATSVKKGAAASGSYSAQGDITSTNTYDGANRVTQTVSAASSLSLTSSAAYDLAGRLSSSTAPGGYTTGYAYTSGGRITTVTMPGGATKIAEAYIDGQTKSVTGTAVAAQYSGYSVNGTSGYITQQVNIGTSTSTALVKTTADWLGRAITEVRPGWNGSDVTRAWTYDYRGLVMKLTQPGLADTLYEYDTVGTLVREGLDLNGSGTFDLATDRITDHGWTYFTTSSNWWQRQTTTTYATTGSTTSTQIGKVETQLTGLAANRLSRTDSYDIFGNVTTGTVDVNRSGKTVTNTTDVPDSTTDAVGIAYNGLAMSARDTAGNTTTFGYDALGRQLTSTDPRTGTTTTAYVSGSSQVYTVTDPASIVQATYTYDSAGRVSSVKDGLNKYAYTSYTNRNEVYRQWGDTVVPVEYGYDNWGHQTTMKTYRGGSGWTGSTWPASPGTADTTTWAFHEPTGLLSSKTDAAGRAVAYTYTQAGQIATRDWARILTGTTHVKTTYGYSATTAELTSVDYNDATTDLGYTYNRLGKIATVTDATGTRTLNYNLAGTLELQSEDLSSFFSSKRLTYPYATTGVIGRPTGLQLGTSGSPTADQSITYGYDTYGRFNSFIGGSQTFSYGYATNSNLVATVTNSGASYTDTRTYDATHDWIDNRKTQISSIIKAEFAYAQDNIGRTTSVARTGEVFTRYGNGTEGLKAYYGYDDRSQVTSEVTKVGTTSTVLTGRDDAFAYDTMGNRASSAGTTHNGNAAAYTTNALNQYTQRTVPGIFDVAGAFAVGTTVTVNGSSTGVTRHGEYFFKGQSQSNNPNPVFNTLVVSDGTTPYNLPAFTAGTPEAMAYDDDGNLLSDGRWDYTYDAENRLVSVQTHTALSPSPLPNADARRLEFKNDYLGRRVEKLVRSGWNGSTFATVASDEKFVYNGWNLMARLNAASSNAILASYYWGADLSGSLQGAGGVGCLLLIQDSGNSYLPAYDGNGNMYGLIKASDGSLAAAYEYDAFGQTVRESGSYAANNPFRFSTTYTDLDTGLVYYGLRYYSPTLGRFINKDPIEEKGGLNLYGFCGNNGINRWDLLGQYWWDTFFSIFSGGGFGGGFTGGGTGSGGTGIATGINLSVGFGGGGSSARNPAPGTPTFLNPGFQYLLGTSYPIIANSVWSAPNDGSNFGVRTVSGVQVGYRYSPSFDTWYPISPIVVREPETPTQNETPAPPPAGSAQFDQASNLSSIRPLPENERNGNSTRVYVYTTATPGGTAYRHTGTLLVSDLGVMYANRAGPTATFKWDNLKPDTGLLDNEFIDKPYEVLSVYYAGTISQSFENAMGIANHFADLISAGKIPYAPGGNNSNTYTGTFLDWLHLQRPRIPNVPGFDGKLPLPIEIKPTPPTSVPTIPPQKAPKESGRSNRIER